MSDSDPPVDAGTIDPTSDISLSLTQLEEMNAALRKENSQLRSQFDKALQLTSQIDTVTEKNIRLGNELRAAKSQNAELNQRLEILVRANEDLDRRLEQERDSSAAARKQDIARKDREISKLRNRSASQIKQLQSDLQSMTEAKEKVDFEYRKLLAGQKSVLGNAAQFFESSFASITELNSFLEQTISLPKDASRAEVESLEALKTELEDQIGQLTSEKESLISRHLAEIKDLKRQFQQRQKDWQAQEVEQTHRISMLEGQVQGLEEELNRLASESQKVVPDPAIEELSNQLRESHEKSAALQVQVRKLEGMLKSAEHAHVHEKKTHYHKIERLKAEIVDLGAKGETQDARIREQSEKLQENEAALKQAADERDRIQRIVVQVLADSSLPLNTFTLDEFLATGGSELVSAISELRSNRDEAISRTQQLTQIVDKVRQTFEVDPSTDVPDLRTLIADLRTRIERQHSAYIKIKHDRSDLRGRVSDLEGKLEAAAQESTELEEELRHIASVLKSNEQRIEQLESKNEALRTALSERDAALESQQQDSHEKIRKLLGQLESARKELQTSKSLLQSSQAESKRHQARVGELESQIEKRDREHNAAIDQMVREKKLTEAEAKSLVAAAESACHAKVDDQKAKWEQEKRRLLGFVIDQFRQFFNPQAKVDEDSFREVVLRAREELVKLLSCDQTIRTLVSKQKKV
jgi:chromosome segregation ATPase